MEVFIVFIAYAVFMFGSICIFQLYLLRRKRVDADRTREALERMLVKDCDNALSRYSMHFSSVPKKEVGYMTRMCLSHEADMPEFYIAFAGAGNNVLGYARFTREGKQGHKQKYALTGIFGADADCYPVLSLNNEVFTLNEAMKANEVIDTRLDKLVSIRNALPA